MSLPLSGIEIGTWIPPFQSKTGEHPMKPAGDSKKKEKKTKTNNKKIPPKAKNVLLSQEMQLRKWNILPQDAVDPVCVHGDAASVPTCVSLRCGNSPRHKLLVTEGMFGRKHHPAFPPLSWYLPGSSYASLLKTGYQAGLLIWPQKDALMFFYSFVVLLMSWGILAGLHEEILYPFSE